VRCIAVLVVLARVASAHQTSIKYVDLRIDGARVDVAVKLAASDVSEPMGLAPDAKPTPAAAAAAPRVPAYVQRWLAIGNPDACAATPATARVDADNFVEVAWQVQCAQASTTLVLDLSAFFALDKRMEAIVRFGAADDDVVVVRAADSPVTLHAAMPHAFAFGFERALGAACFALALLIVAVRRWRSLAIVLGAFVVAELVALLVGASGVVVVPARLAELIVALSLVYVAAENVVRADARNRVALAVAFGVVHGLWLATAAPSANLGSYVVGVELAIAGTAVVAVPIARRFVGSRLLIPVISTAIFAIGVLWTIRTAM
jgi:uncharacterized membrane protein (UPF0136 family)